MGLLLIWDDVHRHAGGSPTTTIRRIRSKNAAERKRQEALIQKNWFTESWLIEISGDGIYNRVEREIDTKVNVLVEMTDNHSRTKDYEDTISISINSVRVSNETE